MAKVIWGFSGIGKSFVSDSEKIIDADYNLFQWKIFSPNSLHGTVQNYEKDPAFPQNYIDYVKSVNADVVLVNCHLSLLEHFENVVLVYPDVSLKEDYIQRYVSRGDNTSFISYMEMEFERIIETIEKSPYRKYKITDKGIYLKDVIERKEFWNNMFLTKKDMIELLSRGKDLINSEEYKKTGCNTLDKYQLGDISDAGEYSQAIFEGKVEFDIDVFKGDIERANNMIAKELVLLERRGGLSNQELTDKITQGIVNGALSIRYNQIAPYSYGYEVTFGGKGPIGSTRDFKNRWECYCNFFEIGNSIAGKIENDKQNNEVFGKRCEALNIRELLDSIDKREKERIQKFIPEKDTDFKRAKNSYTYPYRNDVATVMDVHAGKGLDGIVLHHYHGTYESMTPSKQNSLVEMLVYMNGFCLDALKGLGVSGSEKEQIANYLKKHGTDITSPEKLQKWIRSNPEKCALPENRVRKIGIEEQIAGAKNEQKSKRKSIEEREIDR